MFAESCSWTRAAANTYTAGVSVKDHPHPMLLALNPYQERSNRVAPPELGKLQAGK